MREKLVEAKGLYKQYMSLDFPNAFTRPSPMAEQSNIAGITLWVVGANEREECALARTILAFQRPSLAFVHRPAKVFQYRPLAISNRHIIEMQYLPSFLRIEG